MTTLQRALALGVIAAALTPAAFVGEAAARWDRFRAVDGNSFATDTLDPPTALAAGETLLSVTLSWTPTVDAYATGYRVLRGTASGGPYTVVATVTPRTAAGHVDDPPGSGTFYYVVESVSGGWTSARSNEASAFTL